MGKVYLSSGDATRTFSSAACATMLARFGLSLRRYHDENYLREGDPLLSSTVSYFNTHIFQDAEAGITSKNVSMSSGTTGAFHSVLSRLKLENESLKRRFPRSKLVKMKPTVIVVSPTYGNFVNAINNIGLHCLKLITDEEDDWDITPERLDKVLNVFCKERNLLPVAFFDSNPSNPVGRIRTQEEVNGLAQVIDRYNTAMRKRFKKIAETSHNTYRPMEVRVVDDCVYYGTEHDQNADNSEEMGFFAKSLLGNEYTTTLFGISKIGLASIRGGLCITNDDLSYWLRNNTIGHEGITSLESRIALSVVFSDQTEREQSLNRHLLKTARIHSFRLKLLKCLIEGIDSVELTKLERARVHFALARNLNLRNELVTDLMKNGIEGAKISSNAKAGFFELVDFTDFFEELKRAYGLKDITPRVIPAILEQADISVISGERIGLQDRYIVRASASISEDEMVKGWAITKATLLDFREHCYHLWRSKLEPLAWEGDIAKAENING